MKEIHTGLYGVMRRLIGLALGFYFRRIERFHPERVPKTGPVLFTSNHPNSLTDSFVIGAAVPRKVNFVGTVQLFRFKPVKAILARCGVIPINRVKDDPKAMHTITATFEACYQVLERGEAIGIFPEGVTYDDSRLKEIKSGAARMALELEHRHGGKLGLQLVPVGLTYSAKELYRSDALVNFGEPIRAADFIADYAEHRKDCIHRLTDEIERRIQSLIVHIPRLDHTRVVEGVRRLYFDRLLVGRGQTPDAIAPVAEQLVVTQQIADAVEQVSRTDPDRAAAFAAKLDLYERRLNRLRISDETLALFPDKKKLFSHSFGWAIMAVLGAPVAIYGWAHRLIPYLVVRWASGRFAEPGKHKAQAATTTIVAGVVAFGVGYTAFVLLVHWWFGWRVALWYALSLPIASLMAHYYWREVRKLSAGVRNTIVWLRAPIAVRRMITLRAGLVAEIESVRMARGRTGERTVV
jgi:glycerol-3-phosphate O-acyltransferase/dihydroxyacetone phosphate acyltransferase